MGPLIIMVVLVCGFWYTQNHYQSRIKLARSNGWNAYFYVAMHGCKFAILGFLVVGILFFTLLFLSTIINILGLIWPSLHADWYSWLTDIKIMSYPLFCFLNDDSGVYGSGTGKQCQAGAGG